VDLDAKLNEEREMAQFLIKEIDRLITRPVRFMEVCGTHTVAIFRAGIRQLLPEKVDLVSGPGCPVCVTPDTYMDKAIAYAQCNDVILTTFGDMLKVPGTRSSLGEAKAAGADIRIVYSSLESLEVAEQNPDKKVVFLAVGFETTAPTAAATVLQAEAQGLKNFYVLSAHKLVPPALRMLVNDPEVKVDGFLLPGHVCVITGTKEFGFLTEEYHIPGVVTGFEALDILRSVYRLAKQVNEGAARIENEYGRVVRAQGNPAAWNILQQVYEPADAYWRGIGMIPLSGLKVNEKYRHFDIEEVLPIKTEGAAQKTACRCGEVLRGIIKPMDCPLFGKACVPTHAVGPCMVSVEGVCAAWYKYGSGRFTYGK
jgi:hydrogenase expression/formation protein HypD